MNMKEIEVLSELTNYHTFLDAANGLSYSPSTISKYVSNVEEELGIKIFVRGNRANELSLTPEGCILMREFQQINIDYQHMLEMVKQLRGTFDNILRIGSQARIGNKIEQEILASFLLQNTNADMEHVKMNARDLTRLLISGKLDALFLSVFENARIEELVRDTGEYSDTEITLIDVERDMYLGISDKYMTNIEKEASFADFKDFSFAFSFPSSTDERDAKAIEPFLALARKHGFQLKAAYFGAHDSTIFKIAKNALIAVATTNIPAQYEGIKFLKVSDWSSYTNLVFVCMKKNNKKTLLNLKKNVAEYQRQTGILEKTDSK